MGNTLICAVTSRHFAATSAFFSSMVLSLVGKNMVIGKGRSRSALNSSPLIEEIRREYSFCFQEFLEERYLSQNYVLELCLQKKSSVYTIDYES